MYALGQALEGAAAFGFYQRITVFLTTGEWHGAFREKIPYYLARFFVLLLAITLIIHYLRLNPELFIFQDQIYMVWTIAILLLSFIGTWYRLQPARGILGLGFILGIMLCIGGTEIFNLNFPRELLAIGIGTFTYSIGFWLVAFLWIVQEQTD